jgi:hypothetical protein
MVDTEKNIKQLYDQRILLTVGAKLAEEKCRFLHSKEEKKYANILMMQEKEKIFFKNK